MADDDDLNFDFEAGLEPADAAEQEPDIPPDVTAEEVGQQPANFKKNYRQTVCTYWLRGLCMKGDTCGFLHQFDPARMPVCRTLIKTGKCDDLDCPYKHSLDDIKECNMYKLGFCIYGSSCRYKHTKQPGPPPDPAEVEGAKPREFRDKSTFQDDERDNYRGGKRQRLALTDRHDRQPRQLALPAPEQHHHHQQQYHQHQQQYQQHQQQHQQHQGGYSNQQQHQQQQHGPQPPPYPPPAALTGAAATPQQNPAATAAMLAAAARNNVMQQQYGLEGGGRHPPPPPQRQKGMPSGMHLVGHQQGGAFLPGMVPGAVMQGMPGPPPQQQQQQQAARRGGRYHGQQGGY